MNDDKSPSISSRPQNVVIVGGSLSALMHGLMFHRIGSSVRIFEQCVTDNPDSHMAGVGLGPDVLRLLERFDRVAEIPLGIPSVQLQSLDQQGKAHPFLKARRILSSWDALYFRLRANFDMLASDHVPFPPLTTLVGDENTSRPRSTASYEAGKQVLGVESLETGQLRVTYKDLRNYGKEEQVVADLVLGADGPNSVMRKLFHAQGCTERRYAGYLAWRGVVPEEHVSEATRDIFRENITYSILKGGAGHVIVYNIPGRSGSVEPGKRFLNFCWYTNTSPDVLDAIMTDIGGVRHHTKLAPAEVQPRVWEMQRAVGRTVFAPPYVEVLENISSPFIHLITDYISSQISFLEGRVLLVGDASALLRPHIAFSTNQAAYQTFITEKMIQGEITVDQWEYQILEAAHLHWRRSIWFGEFFQRPLHIAIGSALRYWVRAARVAFAVWMRWLPNQAI